MEKERITVKDLKKFLEGVDENAPVYVDTYKGEEHYKEFLQVAQYDENGKKEDKELLIVSELLPVF